jgi:hypothetical protein
MSSRDGAGLVCGQRLSLPKGAERIVRLYGETARPEKAAEWRRKVDESRGPQRKGR